MRYPPFEYKLRNSNKDDCLSRWVYHKEEGNMIISHNSLHSQFPNFNPNLSIIARCFFKLVGFIPFLAWEVYLERKLKKVAGDKLLVESFGPLDFWQTDTQAYSEIRIQLVVYSYFWRITSKIQHLLVIALCSKCCWVISLQFVTIVILMFCLSLIYTSIYTWNFSITVIFQIIIWYFRGKLWNPKV